MLIIVAGYNNLLRIRNVLVLRSVDIVFTLCYRFAFIWQTIQRTSKFTIVQMRLSLMAQSDLRIRRGYLSPTFEFYTNKSTKLSLSKTCRNSSNIVV